MTRLAGRLLGVLALVASALVLFGAPAHACSCAMASTAQLVDIADEVFSGTVTATERPEDRVVVLTVAVDRAFKGEVAREMRVVTGPSEGSCGLGELPVGRRLVFLTSDEGVYAGREGSPEADGAVFTGLCAGNAPARPGFVRQIEKATGPGHAPTATRRTTSGGAARADGHADGHTAGSDDGVAVWPFIGGVLVIALGAATWTARRTT